MAEDAKLTADQIRMLIHFHHRSWGRFSPLREVRPDHQPRRPEVVIDRFDTRAYGGSRFCGQCDELVAVARARACSSRFCSLREEEAERVSA